MPRRIATVSNLLAMLMVMFSMIVPHHHHQAVVCIVREVCELDGCCNDEHTAHAETDPDESEPQCISHEGFYQSDNLRQDDISAIAGSVAVILHPTVTMVRDLGVSSRVVRPFSPPLLLSCRINC